MTYDEAMEGEAVTLGRAKAELARHGYTVTVGHKDGKRIIIHDGKECVTLPLNSKSILEWLGY